MMKLSFKAEAGEYTFNADVIKSIALQDRAMKIIFNDGSTQSFEDVFDLRWVKTN